MGPDRPRPNLHGTRRGAKLDDANADSEAYTAHERLLEKTRELMRRSCSIHCVVQLLPDTPNDPLHPGNGSQGNGPYLDNRRTYELKGEANGNLQEPDFAREEFDSRRGRIRKVQAYRLRPLLLGRGVRLDRDTVRGLSLSLEGTGEEYVCVGTDIGDDNDTSTTPKWDSAICAETKLGGRFLDDMPYLSQKVYTNSKSMRNISYSEKPQQYEFQAPQAWHA